MSIVPTLSRIAVAAAVSMAAASANAAFDFTVDEGPYGGNEVTAQRINGGYVEVLTFGPGNLFNTAAVATFSQFYNEGNPNVIPAQLGTTYSLYAIFTAAGTVNPVVPGITQFNGTNGTFTLYLDANNNTTTALGVSAFDPITRNNFADDIELAYATNLGAGSGLLTPVGGFFDLVFDDFTLTAEGSNYFVKPSPFYLKVNVDGDFDQFSPTGNQRIDGDVSAKFVPEPGSLALAGLAMLALGAVGRRRV